MKNKKERTSSKNSKIIANDNQKRATFSVVEAYKNVRVNLINFLARTDGKVVAISSPNASEGKSTTAVNIAITMSQLNKKVVLIDSDCRRATIHQKLKVKNTLGCIDVISGIVKLEDVISGIVKLEDVIKTYNPYLDLITSGSVSNNPSELFSSNAFDRMLTELKNVYDYVIIDTPPINLVSDTLVISQKCDGLVMVVRANSTPYKAFESAISAASKIGINILGTIINGIDTQSSRYSKYKYSKYKYNNYTKYYTRY